MPSSSESAPGGIPPEPAPGLDASSAILFRALIDQSSDGFFVAEPESGRILDVNERACSNLEYTRSELLRLTMLDIEAAYDGFTWPAQVEMVRRGELELLETAHRRKTGETFPVEISLGYVTVAGRAYMVATVRDITEKKQLETKYLRAQRLESIGRLAGGIAHDLNNVLTPITLSIELLRTNTDPVEKQTLLDLIESSARRGSGMIKQILTFARGLKGERLAVDMGELISEMSKIARETFPRSVQMRLEVERELWKVRGDTTQLHQVLMNLCVNACDAMPDGGLLTISGTNFNLTQSGASKTAHPGPYVVVSVRDTGVGMPQPVLDRLFEPFFTTKSFGKGTGLGLATALGIVEGHGGFLTVESELQKGTCFHVHLPALPAGDVTVTTPPRESAEGLHQKILVVDDEKTVRLVTQAVLRSRNYDVLTASDGAEAVSIYKERQEEIRAVIMDLAMPFMDGATAIQEIRKINRDVPILAVSGLVDEQEFAAKNVQYGVKLLHKPYSPGKLLDAVEEALTGRSN